MQSSARAALPHEHEKVAVGVDGRDRSVPEIAGVIDALAPMADEGLGPSEIRTARIASCGATTTRKCSAERATKACDDRGCRSKVSRRAAAVRREPGRRPAPARLARSGSKRARVSDRSARPSLTSRLRRGIEGQHLAEGAEELTAVQAFWGQRSARMRSSLVGQDGLEEASEARILRRVEHLVGTAPPRRCARHP